jgi:hypothetical protein
VNEEPLEAVSPAPQLPFHAVQQPASLTRELQLTFDVIERLGCKRSPCVCVFRVLESLSHAVQRFLCLEDAPGSVLRHAEQLAQLGDPLADGRLRRLFTGRVASDRAHQAVFRSLVVASAIGDGAGSAWTIRTGIGLW